MLRRLHSLFPLTVLSLLVGLFSATRAQDRGAIDVAKLANLKTVAEASEFKSTASGAEVEAMLKALDSASANARLEQIGESNEGRPLWALVMGRSDDLDLPLAKEDPRMVVVLLGGIHSGECDGKEALLAMSRDILIKAPKGWWEHFVLVCVPNFSADSAERMGAHRPGQVGPVNGMGIRENAQGMDLNRDFVKLETPEVRSLVKMIDRYNADVLIDTHTTNGSLHRFELTYDLPHNPATPASLRDWARSKFFPQATSRMKEKGFETFYYGNFDTGYEKWETYGHEPRYSTEYMGLRGRLGILSESYSYASYKTRIDSTYAFVSTCLDLIAENHDKLAKEFSDADRRLMANSKTPVKTIPIRADIAAVAGVHKALGYQYKEPNAKEPTRKFPSSSDKDNLDRLDTAEYSVVLWNDAKPSLEVDVARAYILPPDYAWAADRLHQHGIQIEQCQDELSKVAATEYRITEAKSQNFQGLNLFQCSTEPLKHEITVARGSFVVRTDQPLGVLASYLLEPMSDENLATWGFVTPKLRKGDFYPFVRIEQSTNLPVTKKLESIPATEKLSLEKLFDPERTVSFGGDPRGGGTPRWMPGSNEYLSSRNNRWSAIDAATGAMRSFDLPQRLVTALGKLEAIGEEAAKPFGNRLDVFDEELHFALINHKQDLYLFDATTNEAKRLTSTPDLAEEYAELSPNGQHVAFISKNNLFTVNCQTGEQSQLTSDGSEEILNGVLDWVYQEEIYGRGNFKAYWWSPDNNRLAFLQLNQTPVSKYMVSDSISVEQSLENTRYPKSGAPLPGVQVFVADVDSKERKPMDLGAYPADDRLVVRVDWHPDGKEVCLQIQNRIQSWLELIACNADAGTVRKLFREQGTAWIDVLGPPHWLADGDFLWLSDLPNGRRHVYRIDAGGSQRTSVTQGDWDVEDISLVQKDGKAIWITANNSSPVELQVSRVDLETQELTQVTKTPANHRPTVHPAGKFFFDTYSSVESPSKTVLFDRDGKLIRTLNVPANNHHRFLDINPPQLMTIPARDGQPLESMLIAPPNVDLSKPNQKYPVLIHVYGGPRAPTVRNAWSGRDYLWHQYLAQQGFFVLLCDNRAARGKGAADTWKIYKDLGRVETQDLEDAVTWLKNQPWADGDRIGMWGWSYGGYFTSYAMTHTKSFRAGIAGAPVTDWKNYDAVYTERFMDVPKNNEAGYKSSSAVEAAADLHGRILVIHGERDDNVHISNTLQFANALQRAGKQFDLMIYPKNRHGIGDPRQRYHMYTMMTEFLLRNLKGDQPTTR
jgi:dipeptidyl-peptidase 4